MLLLACQEPAPADTELGPPTDTFPSFYGSVPKNVLFISVDTTRRDMLGHHGNTEGLTPFLDSLFQTGLALENHRACSDWTMPGMMCASTGMANIEAGLIPDLYYSEEALMPLETPTLASRLATAGYDTMLATSNSWFSQDHQTSTGFATIERPDNRTTTSMFDSGIALLREQRLSGAGQPYFLHVHIKEPHPPYNPPDDYLIGLDELPEIPYDVTDRDVQYEAIGDWPDMTAEEQEALSLVLWFRYKAEIRWLDDQLAAAFSTLYAEGFLDDTLVIIFNDHGEQFWEHGEQTHAWSLNAEENNGFGLLWAPNIVPGSWEGPTVHEDFAPTVLSLLGQPLDGGLTGIPIGEAPDDRAMDFVTAGRVNVIQSAVQSGWKLIYHWQDGSMELYDTVNDPTEANNLYSWEHEKVAPLWEILQPRTALIDAMMERYEAPAPQGSEGGADSGD